MQNFEMDNRYINIMIYILCAVTKSGMTYWMTLWNDFALQKYTLQAKAQIPVFVFNWLPTV